MIGAEWVTTCKTVEDMHHIFVACPEYAKLRDEAMNEVVKRTLGRIQALKLEETCTNGLLQKAKSFFIDCNFTWPLHYSFYYLGHVPIVDSLISLENFKNWIQHEWFIHNIKGDWHMSYIRLASHIYGQLQRETVRKWDVLNKKGSGWEKMGHQLQQYFNSGPLRHVSDIVLSLLWQRQISKCKQCKQYAAIGNLSPNASHKHLILIVSYCLCRCPQLQPMKTVLMIAL